MVLKYCLLWILDLIMWVSGMLLAPVLPLFRITREGPTDNSNGTIVGPYLPDWLFWFSTNYDNSLWGDAGWREIHCKDDWQTHWGMTKWLWRNCVSGLGWSVLAHKVSVDETFTLTHSGLGMDIDKSRDNEGWFLVKSSTGAWHYRSVKIYGRIKLTMETGWLLDVYVKDRIGAQEKHPRTIYIAAFPVLRLTKS